MKEVIDEQRETGKKGERERERERERKKKSGKIKKRD